MKKKMKKKTMKLPLQVGKIKSLSKLCFQKQFNCLFYVYHDKTHDIYNLDKKKLVTFRESLENGLEGF